MPRITRQVSAETIRIREALAEHIRNTGHSVNFFAALCGVRQYTLSRFITGVTKNITPAIRSALGYAGIDCELGITAEAQPLDNARLRRALEKTWDGSPEMAELLADIIEAVGPALARCTRTHQERS
jgi:hypothetical protein